MIKITLLLLKKIPEFLSKIDSSLSCASGANDTGYSYRKEHHQVFMEKELLEDMEIVGVNRTGDEEEVWPRMEFSHPLFYYEF